MKTTIERNTSDLPNRAWKVLIRFAVKSVGKERIGRFPIQFSISTRPHSGYGGRAWVQARKVYINGAGKWNVANKIHGWLDTIAHELEHLAQWRERFKDGKLKEGPLFPEDVARRAGDIAVDEWKAAGMDSVLARAIAHAKESLAMKEQRVAASETPQGKLAKIQARILKWQRKERLAANRVKALKRKAAYYESKIKKGEG